MRKRFLFSLAADNLKKNRRLYLPFLLSSVLSAAMFYIICSLTGNTGLDSMMGADVVKAVMQMGAAVVAIFIVIFLFYTNRFLMRRRQKEFGLFHILGMEKKHIAAVLFFESGQLLALTLLCGIPAGILLDKLIYLVLLRLMGASVPLGFSFSGKAAALTVLLFALTFLLLFLRGVFQLRAQNPAQLLKSEAVGEKEPKARWFMALLGILCLGGGYGISLFVENPLQVLSLFFVAVMLVILGTYLLFSAGSVAFLKLLKKNKKYYYRPNHFISVSGLIYRMKQNAVGLGNICILSTMVLVMLSATICLWLGLDQALSQQYPQDITVLVDAADPDIDRTVDQCAVTALSANGMRLTEKNSYTYLSFTSYQENENTFSLRADYSMAGQSRTVNLFFMTVAEYNRWYGAGEQLGEGEVLACSSRLTLPEGTIRIAGEAFTIRKIVPEMPAEGNAAMISMPSACFAVKDEAVLRTLYDKQKAVYGDNASPLQTYYGYDGEGSETQQKAAAEFMAAHLNDYGWTADYQVRSRVASETDVRSLYGGFLFLGIFLSILFVTAAILIIYYKQISEGYEDRSRFEILQKVGMDRAEVKKTVRSQILLVFFLPLLTAGLHLTVAMPALIRLLTLFSLSNAQLFVLCALVCFAVFAVLYFIVYTLTAKAYYQIVKAEPVS